jgi:hypothetical protein
LTVLSCHHFLNVDNFFKIVTDITKQEEQLARFKEEIGSSATE